MKKNWWKYLCVVLWLYVIIAGLLVPLRPGIQSSSPISANCGDKIILEVKGYNTLWIKSSNDIRAWLKESDENIIRSTGIDVIDERHLTAHFTIPNSLLAKEGIASLALVIDDVLTGPCILPNALAVKGPWSMDSMAWKANPVSNLHFTKSFRFPYRNVLYETIRNTFFHVPLWMAMYALLALAVICNILFLANGNPMMEERAYHLTLVSLLFGTLGIATGMIWAHFTWGRFWSWDIKQSMALLAMLMYVAYVFIRFSIPDEMARRKFNAVYGIFAFIMIFPLLYVIPRMAPSLHPGSGGNPAFSSDDMDDTMRMVFYPAIIGYFLLGLWMAQISFRYSKIKLNFLLNESTTA